MEGEFLSLNKILDLSGGPWKCLAWGNRGAKASTWVTPMAFYSMPICIFLDVHSVISVFYVFSAILDQLLTCIIVYGHPF